MRYVRQKKIIQRIEEEFEEPVSDVLQGFADMGYSYCTVAQIVDVSPDTMKRLGDKYGVEFPRHTRPETEQETRDKIAAAKRLGRRKDAMLITWNGETKHLSAWSRELGVPVGTLWGRIKRFGMTPEEAFTRKPHAKRPTGAALGNAG